MAMAAPSAWVIPAGTPTSTVSSPTSAALILHPKNGGSKHYSNLTVRASSSDAPGGPPDEESKPQDPAKLAFAKAKAYQNAKLSKPAQEDNPAVEFPVRGGNRNAETRDSVKQALQRAKEYKENKGVVGKDSSLPERTSNSDPTVQESVKLATERARDYEKNKGALAEPSGVPKGSSNWRDAAPDSVKSSMSRASEYEKSTTAVGSGGEQPPKAEKTKMGKPEGLKVSSLDFLGFDFSDKNKGRGIPAGLVPTVDPSFGDLPEVEIIVGDMSKFESSASATQELSSDGSDENAGLYKPKVSTWGVFPRPSNISKTFGGGKNIRPGEALENAETKAIKEERTRQMIATYQNKIGLTIDAKVKAKCEKAMKEGNQLMDAGKLREALPYYEEIMNSVVFKNELHGFAALQWSICQDSLNRPDDARVMYEKLQSHPNVQVSKKAKQFMFGFQAMEMMKVASSSSSSSTGYETYFDAFLPDRTSSIPAAAEERDDTALWQVVPYLLLLASPVFIVLGAAIKKSF